MRSLLFAAVMAVVVGLGCGVESMPTDEPGDCMEVAADLARSAQQLRSVSYTPSPEAVDEAISLGIELEECLSN